MSQPRETSYIVGTLQKHLNEALLMSTHKVYFDEELEKIAPELSPSTPLLVVQVVSAHGYKKDWLSGINTVFLIKLHVLF